MRGASLVLPFLALLFLPLALLFGPARALIFLPEGRAVYPGKTAYPAALVKSSGFGYDKLSGEPMDPAIRRPGDAAFNSGAGLAPAGLSAPAAVQKTSFKTFGLYQWDKEASTYEEGLKKEIDTLGALPSYALYFVDLKRGFPKAVVEANAEHGVHTILSQEICTYFETPAENPLDSVLKGRHDAYFRGLAREARKFGKPLYYRFGYEMNGTWVQWGERPKQFRRAWVHVHRLFREEKAHNVKWVFSPNVVWGGRTVEKDLAPYYPGTDYVDIVGLDGYNFGDRHSAHHRWQSFSEIFGPSIDGLKRYFPDKPIWINEVGCADDPRKAAWIRDFLAAFHADPALKVFIWFNEDKQYAGEPNWRFDSDHDSLDEFRRWAAWSHSISRPSLPSTPGNLPVTGRGEVDEPVL